MISVLVLSGGQGIRLKSIWKEPKCLVPVNGIPFLDYLLQELFIFNKVFSVGKDGIKIIDYIRSVNSGIFSNIDIITDLKLIGTYNAVKEASSLIYEDDFLLVNSDTLFDIDLEEFFEDHMKSGKSISVALKKINNDVGNFMQKDYNGYWSTYRKEGESYLNTGVYYINKKVFDIEFEDESGPFEKVLNFFDLNVEVYDEFFIDIGTEETYRAANYFVKNMITERYWDA